MGTHGRWCNDVFGVVGPINGRWHVAEQVSGGVLAAVGDCPTEAWAWAEAARLNGPPAVSQTPRKKAVRQFDGDQALLWEAD